MKNNPNAPFSTSRAPTFPASAPAVVQAPPQAPTRSIEQQIKIDAAIRSTLTEFAGIKESFVLYAQPGLLRFPAPGTPMAVATYRVPLGRTLEIDRVDWWLSEPFLYGNGQFGWRPTVDGSQLPNWSSQTAFNRPDVMFLPIAPNVSNEPRFSPIFLYAESVLTIEAVELGPVGAFNANVWASVYIYGTLREPGGVVG